MLLAELEVHHSRPIAPTRRIALGRVHLPADTDPGSGAILLGGVVARHIGGVNVDHWTDLERLADEVERGMRIAQPRLRHRFQQDRVGLLRSRHQLLLDGRSSRFVHDDDKGAPVQHVLGAIYAASRYPLERRRTMLTVIRRGLRWIGGDEHDRLIAHLCGKDTTFSLPATATTDPLAWALDVLGFEADLDETVDDDAPERDEVQRRFRTLLRDAHPDQGGEIDTAAHRIAELAEARRILLR